MMQRLLDILTGTRRVTLTDNTLGLLSRKGRITAALGAGEHRIKRNAMPSSLSI